MTGRDDSGDPTRSPADPGPRHNDHSPRSSQMDTIPTDGGDLNLTDSPTMTHALEGVFAIPTCLTPGCDGATEAFTDSCTGCIAGDDDVYVEIDGGAA